METRPSTEIKLEAVIKGARAILEKHTFAESARAIFDLCRELTGAVSGYVALLSEDGHENEVLFLEAGGMPCSVDPQLPMPIRGLRATAYETHSTVYENDFMNSQWLKYMPEGHVVMHNVMFAPLNIEGKTLGIMGLANIPTGFTDEDASGIPQIEEKFGISTVVIFVCTTGISRDRIQHILDHGDIVWSCASREVREKIGARSLLQITTGIPVFVLTRQGLDFVSAYCRDSKILQELNPDNQYLIAGHVKGERIQMGTMTTYLSQACLPARSAKEPR